VGKELKERVNAGKQPKGATRLRDAAPVTAPGPVAVPVPAPVPVTAPVTTTGPLTDSGATAAAEPVPTGTPTRATA
jgi:hypothetical protein